jgi:hypothetical protein
MVRFVGPSAGDLVIRFQAKSGQDWPLDRGIVPFSGLIILCAAGKQRDSAKVAREKKAPITCDEKALGGTQEKEILAVLEPRL